MSSASGMSMKQQIKELLKAVDELSGQVRAGEIAQAALQAELEQREHVAREVRDDAGKKALEATVEEI